MGFLMYQATNLQKNNMPNYIYIQRAIMIPREGDIN